MFNVQFRKAELLEQKADTPKFLQPPNTSSGSFTTAELQIALGKMQKNNSSENVRLSAKM